METQNQKSHAQKFHPVYVFNALIGFDDSNEENFGIAGPDHKPKVIDYDVFPTFLYLSLTKQLDILRTDRLKE